MIKLTSLLIAAALAIPAAAFAEGEANGAGGANGVATPETSQDMPMHKTAKKAEKKPRRLKPPSQQSNRKVAAAKRRLIRCSTKSYAKKGMPSACFCM